MSRFTELRAELLAIGREGVEAFQTIDPTHPLQRVKAAEFMIQQLMWLNSQMIIELEKRDVESKA